MSTATPHALPPSSGRLVVITAALFNRMVDAGMLDDYGRVELWDGVSLVRTERTCHGSRAQPCRAEPGPSSYTVQDRPACGAFR